MKILVRKNKITILVSATIVLAVVMGYYMNDSYYMKNRISIVKYAQDAKLMTHKDILLEKYASYIEKKMHSIGYKHVSVKIAGADVRGVENEISIEAVPVQSPLDKLLGVTPEKIAYSYAFINRQ